MRFSPYHDYVVVKQDEAEAQSGMIAIPEFAQQAPNRGTVIAVGPGTLLPDGTYACPEVEPGDRVLYQAGAGIETLIEGRRYFIMKFEEIVGSLGEIAAVPDESEFDDGEDM